MTERVVNFGPEGSLVGILTEPEAGQRLAAAPVVLMWNVGMNHRVGPWRFNVELSRKLAQRGVASLRFDVSGLGDSETTRDTRSDQDRAVADVREAMAFLEKRKVARSFILVGFCSSVDAGHKLTVEDPRIVGMVYLEGYAHRTRGFWLRYPLRVVDPARMKRFLKSTLPRVFGDELAGWGSKQKVFEREYPPLHTLRADFPRMLAAGKRLLFVYVGGDTDYNHHGQFSEMYGVDEAKDELEIDYHARMDHTFFRVADRAHVLHRVASWVAALAASAREPALSADARDERPLRHGE